MTLEIDTENLLKRKAETIKRLQQQILEFTRELHSSNKEIIELKEHIVKMKCCENCKYYKPCVTVNETIGNECEDFYNGCNNSVIAPFEKWELKE